MRIRAGAWLAIAAIALPAETRAQGRKPPYYASIAAGEARMRTGPGRNYPASWLYVRAGLPIKVVAVYREWRKVEDPDGTQGWMQANLLTEKRTAMVQGGPVSLRGAPAAGERVLWRAAPGVIGTLNQCARGWCRLDIHGRAGYVEQARLWGTAPGEVVE